MSYIGNQPTSLAFVTDQFSGTGSQTAFTMSVAPANASSVLVAVTGVLQDPSTYSVSGTTLTFSAAPPSGTGNISVRYLGIPASGVTTTAYRTVTEFTATAGQTSFSVPSYTVGYIDVYRNGSKLGTADFTATTGTTVVLATGALAGDIIQTVSFYVSSVLNAIPATAGAVNTTYIADNAITTAKIAPGAVAQADLASGVAGTGPMVSVYLSAAGQSIPNNTETKVMFDAEEYDTASCYANGRFTPNVAGYYQCIYSLGFSGTAYSAGIDIYFKKNTSTYKIARQYAGGGTNPITTSTTYVYLNGTTDYIEIYTNQSSGSTQTLLGQSGYSDRTYFQAALVRAA